MSQLINPTGPEANNQRAEEFEDQVVAWASTLGWDARCRNVDLFNDTGDQSKGVDVLLAYDDPQLGERLGIIGEAKIRHPLRADRTQAEVATLGKKLATLGGVIPKLTISDDVHATRTGFLIYDASPFNAEKLSEALASVQPVGTSRAEWPREIWVVGPDTLVGMADAFARAVPSRFYWPPFARNGGEWSAVAPPHQVGAGVLAWKSWDHKINLWLRDAMPHDEDFPAIRSIAWEWRLNFDRVICSSVARDQWRTQATRWAAEVKKAENRDVGHVPAEIEPRGLTFDSLTPFVDRWGQA